MNETQIIDGNQGAPVVDANEFARALVREMQASNGAAVTPQQKDFITEAVEDLRSKNYDDDFIQGQLRTALGISKQVDVKIDATVASYMNNQKQSEAGRVVARAIKQYAKDDELIKAASESVRAGVQKAFNNSSEPEIASARHKFIQNHEIDEDVFEMLVDREVAKIWKAAGKDGAKRGGVAGTGKSSARPVTPSEADSASADNLTEIQQTVYDAHMSMLKRTGLDATEAGKRALAAATRVKK